MERKDKKIEVLKSLKINTEFVWISLRIRDEFLFLLFQDKRYYNFFN